ncbi:HTH-type transcriptional regulator CdhR [Streptomyces sp. AVP053U2]|nr:HTH-type transcriptional regulator CdhR [Streptomyces sp. AVP053U2]
MHSVAILLLDRVIPFDMAAPMQTFDWTLLPDGRPAYRVRPCAETPEVAADGGLFLRVGRGLEALADADTIIVPGRAEGAAPPSPAVVAALRRAAGAGTRIASVCVGAFVLAEAGLLDGLRATTHWVAADRLARAFPHVEVEPDVLYVDNGQILTSAGAAAALDMCLHMIRRDLGSAAAANTARMSVMPLEREGGQAQFIVHKQPPVPRGSALEPLFEWIEDNLAHEVTLKTMAARAGMSERTFGRRFREQTGHHSGAVAAAGPGTARPVHAGEQRPHGRTHRPAVRVRLAHGVPRAVPQSGGYHAVRLPVGVPRATGRRGHRRLVAARATARHTVRQRPFSPSGSAVRPSATVRPRASSASARVTASRTPVVPVITQSVYVMSSSSRAATGEGRSACAICSVA